MDLSQATMSLVNNFAGTLSALIVLAGAVAAIKPIGTSLKHFFFGELYAANDRQDKRLERLELWQLKESICNRRLPLSDRITAGEEYLRRGQNGEIKMLVESLMEASKKKFVEEADQMEQEERAKRGGGV
jgi:hypothetical protein